MPGFSSGHSFDPSQVRLPEAWLWKANWMSACAGVSQSGHVDFHMPSDSSGSSFPSFGMDGNGSVMR